MEMKNFVVNSDYDQLALKGIVYVPSGKKKGIVQIVHGMCEYKERYIDFMKFLCSQGYVAACYDQRGHGDSVETEEDLGWFGDSNAVAIVEDAAKVTRCLKKQYPDLPVVLFGHSMGSMVVRCYLREHDDLIDKLIVCGSPSKNPLVDAAIFLAKTIGLFRGKRHRSKLLSYLSTGKGDKLFPGEAKGAWLSRNRENIDEFYSNPKGRHRFTCNGFENLFKLMKRTYQKRGYRVKNPGLPIHFISGDKDAVIGDTFKWVNATDFMMEVGYENVTGKLYKDFRHELLNDLGRQNVFDDILEYIEQDPIDFENEEQE